MQPLEIVGVILGLACVILTVRQHILCWPTGLGMVLLYIVIFYQAKLYSDMLLQVVYVGLQIYGWHAWLRGGPEQTPLAVSRLSPTGSIVWLLLGSVAAGGLGTVMHVFTDASFPYVDAVATVASLVAQWLMGRKVLESWLIWIFVDLVSIGLYLAKELYPTAILYVVFLGLAAWGWHEWRSGWREPAMA